MEDWQSNEYYGSDEEFLFAIADAMHEEYAAIVESGLLLQIDDPGLLTQYTMRPEWTVADARTWAKVRVDALNHALQGLPTDRIRFHTCYSINQGPRKYELELSDVIDLMLQINAGAYSFEAANPRHEHEWRVWQSGELPEDKVVIPGFVTNSSVMIEHPDTVADRIVRYAEIVGRERVLAGADCGFASRDGGIHARDRLGQARRSGRGRPSGDRAPLAVANSTAVYQRDEYVSRSRRRPRRTLKRNIAPRITAMTPWASA